MNQFLFSFCSVSVQFLFSFCSVSVQFLFSFCSVSVQFLFSFCLVFVQFLFSFCSVSVQFQFSFCLVFVQFLFSFCSVSVQFLFSFCSVSVISQCLLCIVFKNQVSNHFYLSLLSQFTNPIINSITVNVTNLCLILITRILQKQTLSPLYLTFIWSCPILISYILLYLVSNFFK